MELEQKFYSHAKINLTLDIVGRSPNNYHYLNSIVCFASDIFDEISIKINNKDKSKVSIDKGEFSDKVTGHNIMMKALKFFPELNLDINLIKNIPVGAGLGGGSGNVVALIKFLESYFNKKITKEELQQIGSDCHCFYYGKSCLVSGFGEEISPMKIPNFYALLVNPNVSLSTELMYKTFRENGSSFKPRFNKKEMMNNKLKYIINGQNSLENIAKKHLPIISEILEGIKATDSIISRMSGSGPTCFGIYQTIDKMNLAAEKLRKSFPNFWIKTSKLY